MTRYDAILFDFDGVLVDSEPLHYRCWSEILSQHGIPLDWDTYVRECVGINDRLMLAKFCERVPGTDVRKLIDQYPLKRDRFRERVTSEAPFFDGCDEFLGSLGEYKLAIVSSSGRTEIEPPLKAAGLLDHFELLVCGGDVRNHKPSPEPYLLAAERLKAQQPLVVEDSAAGLASARAAGFDVVHVKSPADVIREVRARLSPFYRGSSGFIGRQ